MTFFSSSPEPAKQGSMRFFTLCYNKIMKQEVIDLISKTLEIDPKDLKDDTNLAHDLGVESIDLVDLVTAFEDKYNFEIPDNELKNLQTVKDITDYIEKHKK